MVTDAGGRTAPRADNPLQFDLEGLGEIVATDNGDPTCLVPFPSHDRPAFNGLCLVIVRGRHGRPGTIRVLVRGDGLKSAAVGIRTIAVGHPTPR